jgi:hypothetical protein
MAGTPVPGTPLKTPAASIYAASHLSRASAYSTRTGMFHWPVTYSDTNDLRVQQPAKQRRLKSARLIGEYESFLTPPPSTIV